MNEIQHRVKGTVKTYSICGRCSLKNLPYYCAPPSIGLTTATQRVMSASQFALSLILLQAQDSPNGLVNMETLRSKSN